jgi:hypothetical protein
VLGETSAGRLRVDEFLRRLRPITHGERRVHEQLSRPTGTRDQIVDGDASQCITRELRLASVALNQAAIGAAVAKCTTSSTSMLV